MTSAAQASPPASTTAPATVLCVDDEKNILTALRRLFHPEGYRMLLAESGEQALQLLEAEPVDLIIADMRMPGMDGAELLAAAAERHPDIPRMLLTGFADMESTVRAINRGGIYGYISKPWEESELKLVVRNALERRRLQQQRDALLALGDQQNRELKTLNQSLKAQVEQRSREVDQTAQMFDLAYQEAQEGLRQSLVAFGRIVTLQEGLADHCGTEVAEVAKAVALELGQDEEAAELVYRAGLLRQIGKVGLPPQLLSAPLHSLKSAERRQVLAYPVRGAELLAGVDSLSTVAALVRYHREHYDGSGSPEGLKGNAIPLGARILLVVTEACELQAGELKQTRYSETETADYLRRHAGRRYDPQVVEAFLRVRPAEAPAATAAAAQAPAQPQAAEGLTLATVQVGMVLREDLLSPQGFLLAARGQRLSQGLLQHLRALEQAMGEPLRVRVEAD